MTYANLLARVPNSEQTPVHIVAPFSDVGQLESGRALVGGGRGGDGARGGAAAAAAAGRVIVNQR